MENRRILPTYITITNYVMPRQTEPRHITFSLHTHTHIHTHLHSHLHTYTNVDEKHASIPIPSWLGLQLWLSAHT